MSYRSNGGAEALDLNVGVMKAVPRALRSFLVFLAPFAIAASGCHASTASNAPAAANVTTARTPVPPTSSVATTSSASAATRPHTIATCERIGTRAKPSLAGEEIVTGVDGKPHALFWTKLKAKTQPAKGTVFYLAGGPLSHMMYTDMAAAFQRLSFPEHDVVLYDYFGFNCSAAIQDGARLRAEAANLTMPAMAHDFIQLKRALIGKDTKAYLMGGSHGAMLGAQIVRDYATEIDRAVLFSGDTESGWLEVGWTRFDHLMTKLDAAQPGFAASLEELLASAANGKLTITGKNKPIVVDRPTLEVALWMTFALDSAAQATLPDLLAAARKGERDWLGDVYGAALGLLDAPTAAAPPTESSSVTTFHRCNVWFPKSSRTRRADSPVHDERFFHYDSFVGYWNTLCKDDDALGEHPLHAGVVAGAGPTNVPILGWIGDHDTFDETTTRAHWSALSTNVDYRIMEGWSHDFGPNATAGFLRAADLVKTFYR